MVKAIIDITNHTNHILNIVKAKYGLNDKSEVIDFVTTRYEEEIMDPELRPEFVEKIKKIQKGKFVRVKDFKKRYRLD
jgi:hypothetical protein